MGSEENISASLVGLAVFAGGELSHFTVPRHLAWPKVLSGLGILTPPFSSVSLDDDGFQHDVTSRWFVVDQPLKFNTHSQSPIPIHSTILFF